MRTCHGAGEAGLCVSRPCADCAYRRDSCTYGEGQIGEMGVEVRDLERKLIIARKVFCVFVWYLPRQKAPCHEGVMGD